MLHVSKPAESNASPDASLDFCLRLTRACAILVRRLDNGLGTVHGLSFNDFIVLYHLRHAPGERLRRIDLAERLGLTASGVTRTLLPLEKLGLVARLSDPRDARVAFAILTKAGATLFEHALVSAHAISKETTQLAAADEIEATARLLGQLAGFNASTS